MTKAPTIPLKNKITFPNDAYLSEIEKYQNYTPTYDYTVEKINSKNYSKKFTAKLDKRKTKIPTIFQYFNPYLGLDTFVYQDSYLNTITGPIIDFITWLAMGQGITPSLKLINPEQYGDDEAQRKEIQKDKKILSKLIEVDNSIGDSQTTYDHTFLDKMKGLMKMALTYGRAAYVKINEKNSHLLLQLHPRDMVYNNVDPNNLALQSIQTTVSTEPYFMNELVYAEFNPENPGYRNMFFGFSLQQRMLGPARTIRRIHDTDMLMYARSLWAGQSIIAVEEQTSQSPSSVLSQKLKTGQPLIFDSSTPAEAVSVNPIQLQTDPNGLIELSKYNVNYCLAIAGIPSSLYFDESSANYATLIGKIRAFIQGPIAEYRSWMNNIISKQWYMPNFRDIASPELLEKYTIEVKYTDIDFESSEETAKLLEALTRLGFNLTSKFVGDKLKISQFEDAIDSKSTPKQQESYTINKADGSTDTMRKD